MSKVCSIFFYDGYVGVSPTIINLTQTFSKIGYQVNIYARKTSHKNPDTLNQNTQIIYFSKLRDIPILSQFIGLLYKIGQKDLSEILELFFWFIQMIVYTRNINQSNLTIGVDTQGSIVAYLYKLFSNKKYPIIYLSLELNQPQSFYKKIINKIERLAYKKSICVIIQDQDRFKTLNQYNNYFHPYFFYIPNSPIVETHNNNYSNFFREKFNLSNEKYPFLIVQAGMMDENVYSKTLAKTFASITNSSYALIFHERQKRNEEEPYIKALKEINNTNLFLSLDPVCYSQIDHIFFSTTIGLAFYRNIDSNFSQISMASGKLIYYLKHGKPIIVNNLPSLVELVDKYQIGIVIKDPSNALEIESALEKIINNYEFFSKKARDCYNTEFDFEKKVISLLSFIELQLNLYKIINNQ